MSSELTTAAGRTHHRDGAQNQSERRCGALYADLGGTERAAVTAAGDLAADLRAVAADAVAAVVLYPGVAAEVLAAEAMMPTSMRGASTGKGADHSCGEQAVAKRNVETHHSHLLKVNEAQTSAEQVLK